MLAGFAVGTLAIQCCATLPPWWPMGAALVVAVFAWRRQRRAVLRMLCAFCAACALGAALSAGRAAVRLADALPPALEGVDIAVIGQVDGMPALADDGVHFVLERVRTRADDRPLPTRLALGWYRRGPDDALPAVHAGECWHLTVRLKRPHGTLNFTGFDLEAWLFERNLRATGSVRADVANARIAACAPSPLALVGRVREILRERFLTALGERPYRGVIVALAIGDQQAIGQEQWRVFNRTGVAHLISISGLHITVFATMVGGAAYALARRCIRLTLRRPARQYAAVIGLVAAALYTLVSGAEIPALRTLLMLAVATVGLWLARPGTASVVWLWALAAVLVVDPWASVAAGFWLSFGAVGLLLYAGSGRLAPHAAYSWHQRMLATLAAGSHAQWVVTLGLAPATLVLFQQLSLVAPLANALAIPVVTFAVVPLALAGLLVPWTVLPIAAHAVFEPLMRMLVALAQVPEAAWQQHVPETWTLVVAMVGVLWLLAPCGVPGRALGIVWLLPLLLVTPTRPPQGAFALTALDVGQGLAVVIQTATHQLLFDAGPRYNDLADAGARVVVPSLRAMGASELDMLVVSHADNDHAGGAQSVLASMPVAMLLSSLEADNAVVTARATAPRLRCLAGQQWQWDGVTFTVLYPYAAIYANARAKTNDRSCVLRIDGLHASALLTGDIEARAEGTLIADGAPLAADILVVPHHGSRTSSSPAFVAAVAPSLALFTTGYRNRFGHPRADIVARYTALSASALRSDVDGAVRIDVSGDTLAVATARDARRRYWHDDVH